MLFNSYPFLLFLLGLLPTYWLSPARYRGGILILASLVFYSMWIPQYLLLFLFELGVNYILLLGIVHTARPKLYLFLSVAFSLTLLGYFKYAAFLVSAFFPLISWFGPATFTAPHVLLPLGISFFTFQMLALSVDAYRGNGPVVRSFSEYTLFISFFPQLIAGPILRGWELLPQLSRGGQITSDRVHRASWLITGGLAKKVIFADALLAPYVNQVFAAPGFASAPEHLLAMYSFAFQIYFDFSGYTDIARGVALLLGFELPLNFREPYLSRDPTEFWRRWHITLSTWLRDYLYIPLGGNRAKPTRIYINLLITMLLGGLWHGAGWNFVIWGGMHGLLLALHRMFASKRKDSNRSVERLDVVKILLTFNSVCLLWIFFRAATFQGAASFVTRLFTGSYAGRWPVFQVLIVISCVGLHVLERLMRTNAPQLRERVQAWPLALSEGVLIGLVLGLVAIFGGFGGEFIYFQF